MVKTQLANFAQDRILEQDRLDEFVSEFKAVFPRADQFQRFRDYLQALILPGSRKNIESMAARLIAEDGTLAGLDLAQALQHFVSKSPWEADRLFTATRSVLADRLSKSESIWVVHDGVFPKKGRHSVGVQRQYARAMGRKLSCQVAVVISQVDDTGYHPLAARLYLPSYWLRQQQEVNSPVTVAELRSHTSKAEIAWSLIDELRTENLTPTRIVAEDGYAASEDFVTAIQQRGLSISEDSEPHLSHALSEFDQLRHTLGLDHFEGRTWRGWHHHVSLVFAAHAYLSVASFR